MADKLHALFKFIPGKYFFLILVYLINHLLFSSLLLMSFFFIKRKNYFATGIVQKQPLNSKFIPTFSLFYLIKKYTSLLSFPQHLALNTNSSSKPNTRYQPEKASNTSSDDFSTNDLNHCNQQLILIYYLYPSCNP